jgi:hypothetical protein
MISLAGIDGATMWSDDMPRERAARELRVTVAPDQVAPLRVYVLAPAGTEPREFHFNLRALDADGGADSHETHFDAPGDDE